MYKVKINPWGYEENFKENTRVIEAVADVGVEIKDICSGRGTCGKCKILVEEGSENLSPITDSEKRLLSEEEIDKGFRLSCMTKIIGGPVTVKVPKASLRRGQIILTEGQKVEFEKDPTVRKHHLQLPEPTLEDPTPDYERVKKHLESEHDITVEEIDKLVQENLPIKLREKKEREALNVTAAVWNEEEIISIEPGLNENNYGLAVDIGTSTMVGYLIDLETGEAEAISSILNPQVDLGGDLMTRIDYAKREENGKRTMKKRLKNGINEIIENILEKTEVDRRQIYETVLVGNTAMHHFSLGIATEHLARSPFIPGRQSGMRTKVRDMGIDINPSGYVYWLPINGGWVGADNVAVLLATEVYHQSDMVLVIDIGTNGEVALGNKDKMLVTSTAAGPAFEGANLKHGMRASEGSIENIKIDPETLEPSYETIEGHPPLGICGSGIIDLTAEMLKAGIIKKGGRFNEENLDHPRINETEDGILEYVIAWEEESAIDSDITITQKDIREIQKAKGAIQAAARVLMDRLGVEEIDRVLLAGAFGNYIDKKSAMTIGLFPECDLEKVESIGNAAGEGAKLALIDKKKRKEAEKIPEITEFYEIGGSEEFRENYMKTMSFPHKNLNLYPRNRKYLQKARVN